MSATQKQNHALVLIINSFIRTNKSLTTKKYVQKALDLVNIKLGVPCCYPVNLTTEIRGNDDNNFTYTVKQLLNTMDSTFDKTSLLEAKKLLTKTLNGCC